MVPVLAQHDAELGLLLLLQLGLLLLLLYVLQQLVLLLLLAGLAAGLHRAGGPEAVGIHPVLDILGLRDGEEVLVVPVGPGGPAPNHGPGLPLNGEASPWVADNITSEKVVEIWGEK